MGTGKRCALQNQQGWLPVNGAAERGPPACLVWRRGGPGSEFRKTFIQSGGERLVVLPWLSKRSSLNRGTRSSGVDILAGGDEASRGRVGISITLTLSLNMQIQALGWRNGTGRGMELPRGEPLAHAPTLLGCEILEQPRYQIPVGFGIRYSTEVHNSCL